MRDNKEDMSVKRRKLNNSYVVTTVGILTLVILVLIAHQLTAPKRSIANYCKVYKQENARLAKLPGDTWPSSVFDDNVGDAGEFVKSFGRLETVAPNDIKSDVGTLQTLYQKVDDDPSQALSVSLSGIGPEDNVKQWTDARCKVNTEE